MIEVQRKTIYLQKLELQSLTQKCEGLKRNYDTLSTQSATDREQYLKFKDRVEEAEK